MPSTSPDGGAAPNSLRALLAGYAELRAAGRPFAVASVVDVEGSAFRREGARLLVVPAADARARPQTRGSISGGCLEGEVAAQAAEAVRTGRAALVTLTSHLGDDDRAAFGLGCGGTVRVLVQPVPTDGPGPLDALAQAVAARRTGVLAVATEGERLGDHLFADADGTAAGSLARSPRLDAAVRTALRTGTGRTVRADGDTVRLDVVQPPVRLVVYGTGPDARALVRQGALLGWTTAAVGVSSAPEVARAIPEADAPLAVVDADEAARGLDARTAAVVMTHSFARDRALVGALAASGAGYIGLLGSRRRTARLLAGLPALPPGRLHAPVGLDVGAETPEEIALAACAEILAAFRAPRPAPSPRARLVVAA